MSSNDWVYWARSVARTAPGSAGTSPRPRPSSTRYAAVATAASIDAAGDAAGTSSRKGSCPPSIEFTAS